MAIPNTNDGSQNPPALRCYLNMGTLGGLPETSSFPGGEGEALYAAIRDAGFQGVQGGDPAICRKLGLGVATGGRINAVGETQPLAREWIDKGFESATVHVGWGVEDDVQVDAMVDDILETCAKHDFPIYIETHRATITQDMQRTVKLCERRPDVRFNGDFSHWYTGLEMPYGGMDMKLDFIAPVLERVRFMHGRIGSSGCMQVDIGDGADHVPQAYGNRSFVDDFREMWTRSMAGFLRHAGPGDYLVFAPELLDGTAYYARLFPDASGRLVEESDRWSEALRYVEIARACFEQARVAQ